MLFSLVKPMCIQGKLKNFSTQICKHEINGFEIFGQNPASGIPLTANDVL